MAYAALLSLSQTLDQILIPEKYKLVFEKETLVSVHKNVSKLQTFLEEYWHKHRGAVNPLESRIIDAAYQAEDIIDSIFEDELMIKTNNLEENDLSDDAQSSSTEDPGLSSSDINTKLLELDLKQVNKRMYNKYCFFEVIPIVGMGGIGKTTLARRLYEDSINKSYFDRCIWLVVSQDYSPRKLLVDIMLSIGKPITIDKRTGKESNDEELRQLIHQELIGRRYLIVLDDLWSIEAWDDLNLILPKDTAGNRVIITTKLSHIAHYIGVNPPHEMCLLNEDDSWALFKQKVFGDGFSCPFELVGIGRMAVRLCRGIPLSVMILAGLLKGDTTETYWESILDDLSLHRLEMIGLELISSLSYNHLPQYLKPCFQYVATFPENYDIKANRLIRLWIAEGFVKTSGSKLLEEVAEGYLHDLVGRNILMVSEKARYNNRIKTIRMHPVLRDFGIYQARQERLLDEYLHKYKGAVNLPESRRVDATSHAEDIIEYQAEDIAEPKRDFASLQNLLLEIDLILEEAMKINNNNNPAENWSLPDLSTDNYTDINTKVLEDDFMLIKERIYNKSCRFEVIPIVGMGGIGKSTLARRLYEDSIKQEHFDRCIWVVVSQDYSQKKLLSEIMLSLGKPATGDLRQLIHQELFGRRYLLVVDDLWSEKAWDDLNLILPKDTTGSRILVTTRHKDIATCVGSSFNPPLVMQLLNEFQSWTLFEERVFGEGFSCPSELKQIGKNVVKSCQGLPLTIVVIAGLLKGETTKGYWKIISENIGSSEPTVALRCSKVLSLSYNHLSQHLRPCFLYVTAFPEDYEIKANKLIRMWVAEGFVKPSGSKLLEEVAEGYLDDLVGRSLLIVSKKDRYNDKIKTVRIHDLLKDFGTQTAQQERIHYHHDLKPEYRRVTIDNPASLDILLKLRKPATRSVLISNSLFESRKNSFENLRLLRILEACNIHMKGNVSKLVHLRYLSILLADYSFLKATSELRNIQTLIIKYIDNELIVPMKFWKNSSMRHLILPTNSKLEQPSEGDIVEETNLQTIQSVTNLRFTKKVLVMLLNLRKLKICYECQGMILPWETDWVNEYDLFNLVHLQKLENLAISFLDITSPNFSDLVFPKSLKKLSLDNINGHWKDMSVVGSLPNLEVFKLSWFMSKEGWEPIEDEFLKLKHLQLEAVFLSSLDAESMHFPSLEILVLKEVLHLNEIPSGIGEINTLRVIELVDCKKSIVDSAKQMQADQLKLGNTDLQLLVATSRNYADDQ